MVSKLVLTIAMMVSSIAYADKGCSTQAPSHGAIFPHTPHFMSVGSPATHEIHVGDKHKYKVVIHEIGHTIPNSKNIVVTLRPSITQGANAGAVFAKMSNGHYEAFVPSDGVGYLELAADVTTSDGRPLPTGAYQVNTLVRCLPLNQ